MLSLFCIVIPSVSGNRNLCHFMNTQYTVNANVVCVQRKWLLSRIQICKIILFAFVLYRCLISSPVLKGEWIFCECFDLKALSCIGQVKKLLVKHSDKFYILFSVLVVIKLIDNDGM
jgi:hypothetical protein